MNGRDAVMSIPAEDGFSLALARACHELVASDAVTRGVPADNVDFVAASVRRRLPGNPIVRLTPLRAYGVLVNASDSTRGGHRGVYRMPDPDGVGRALDERGVPATS
jgi:hypothetical protein